MAKFQMKELIGAEPITARLGAGTGAANYLTDLDLNKPVKFVGDSQYDLCVAGDPIEGFITAIETYTADDYTIGSVDKGGRKRVKFDGLQATPGTGTIVIGDYVVAGSITAKGTAGVPKVCKATEQPGALPADLTAAGKQARNAAYAWRVVSFETNGAVGSFGIIERVNC